MSKVFAKKQFHKPKITRRSARKANLTSKNKFKQTIFSIIVVLIFSGLVYLFAYSPVFKVKTVSISGTNKTEVINKIQIITNNHVKMRRFFIVPNNIIFLKKQKLADEINKELNLETLTIEKKLLNTIKIKAKEKIPALLWRDSRDNYYVDKEGYVMTAVMSQNIEYDLPLASRGTSSQAIVNTRVLSKDNVGYITKVADKIESIFKDWHIAEIVAADISNKELKFYTSQGWYIILNTDLGIDKSAANLKKLINQKIENTKKLQYIDLRLEDRIFYK